MPHEADTRTALCAELAEIHSRTIADQTRAAVIAAQLAALDDASTRTLPLAEAADRAGCGVRAIREAIRRGELTATRTGRGARVSAADVDSWAATKPWSPSRRKQAEADPFEAAMAGERGR